MWWFILIPFLWVATTKIIWHNKVSWKECALHLGTVVPITALIFAISHYSAIGDSLILHGYITEKVRDNDSHLESYDCRCRTVTSGSGNNKTTSTVCDTCWRRIYTVDWYLKSTLGNISIDGVSSRSKSVWDTPDPVAYTNAYVGEHCSETQYFKNYVKASPNSLFNKGNYVVNNTTPVPPYPKVHSIYKVDNILKVGVNLDTTDLENSLSDKLKVLGAKKQANIILILTNTKDKNYRYAVEKEWLGGKKNDIVVILGLDGENIIWVDGFTFGLSQGNHLMLTQMFDELRGKDVKLDNVVEIVTQHVDKNFVRKQMKDFEYLARELQPSLSLLIFVSVLQLIANIGITIWSIKNEL